MIQRQQKSKNHQQLRESATTWGLSKHSSKSPKALTTTHAYIGASATSRRREKTRWCWWQWRALSAKPSTSDWDNALQQPISVEGKKKERKWNSTRICHMKMTLGIRSTSEITSTPFYYMHCIARVKLVISSSLRNIVYVCIQSHRNDANYSTSYL